jgi:thiol-disulfide isomerase/thioredoxin
MKTPLPIIVLLLLNSFILSAQNAKEILKNTYRKCQTIQNGYYEMTRYRKMMDSKDTLSSTSNCFFKRLKDDDLHLSAFHYSDGGNILIYTGSDLATVHSWDSSAVIMSKELWAEKIKYNSLTFECYAPLINQKYPIVYHDSLFTDKNFVFKFRGVETVNNNTCYHIQVNDIHKDESPDMKTIRIEYHYWINKADSIPLQYSIEMDNVISNDTMYQYEKNVLKKYELNNMRDKNMVTLNSIPPYYKITDSAPAQSTPLLPEKTVAPNWELQSLEGEKISLNHLRGQLVLVDFFYKSCYPCMLAIPGLQSLHEKYKNEGLKIIGIDIHDTKDSGIAGFLSKRGVTYPVVLGGKDASEQYHVSGLPTIYLIDKVGKIIFSKDGYEKGFEETLEQIIRKNL